MKTKKELPKMTDVETYPHMPKDLFMLWPHLGAIQRAYKKIRAERSRVPLMNHIYEGIAILNYIGEDRATMGGFCLHPLVQADEDLQNNFDTLAMHANSFSFGLALEYRSVANAYLSERKINSIDEIKLSPLRSVNNMLIADKVQNYKDFLLYHKGTHKRSDELDEYFHNWLTKLDCWDVFKEFEGKI